jgi:hypothetical protein
MRLISRFAAGIAGVAVAMAVSLGAANAQRWQSIDRCQPAVDGIATGQGIFGQGTVRARAAARADWEDQVSRRYGPEFARFRYARDVVWDCKRGAVIRAKCVVTAKPCARRIHG